MQVDGVNSGQVAAVRAMKNRKTHQKVNAVKTKKPKVAENKGSEGRANGVISLLQAGHFKGVADIRLRINFYDEIQALESQNLKATASDSFEGFNQAVQEQITVLNESGLLNEDQTAALGAFLANLQNTQTGFLDGGDNSVQSLIERLENDFNSLLGLLNPPAPATEQESEPPAGLEEQIPEILMAESPVEIPVEAESVTEEIAPEAEPTEPNPLQQLVQNFQESVQALIDNLQSDLANTSALPPVSAPSGNGKAYAKFISIYESMLPSQNTKPAEQLDIIEIPGSNEVEVVAETIEA